MQRGQLLLFFIFNQDSVDNFTIITDCVFDVDGLWFLRMLQQRNWIPADIDILSWVIINELDWPHGLLLFFKLVNERSEYLGIIVRVRLSEKVKLIRDGHAVLLSFIQRSVGDLHITIVFDFNSY